MTGRSFRPILLATAVAIAAGGGLMMAHGGWRTTPKASQDPMVVEQLATDGVTSVETLDAAFGRLGYRLDRVAEGSAVPRLILGNVPGDMAELEEPDARKDFFLRLMLPLVLEVNEQVAVDRRRLQAVIARGFPANSEEASWLIQLARTYEVPEGPGALGKLLSRVDVVPPSLALAQAAVESGWGTSRLVRKDRNLFGQTMETGRGVELASFPSLLDAVRSYVRNLNTHAAYESMRRYRAEARGRGQDPSGLAMADSLKSYSELGQAYVDQVRSVMRRNDLSRYDAARLTAGRSKVTGI